MKKIVLASKSIDRREILKRAKIEFEIYITSVDEEKYIREISDPIKLVEELAKVKALYTKEKFKQKNKDRIIIAADTMVVYESEIIGKAISEEQAFQILKKLAGNYHNLITGIAITETFNSKIIIDHDITKVKFTNLNDKEIWKYIKSGEWKGRAGAYSIREKASLFTELIDGSTSNVIGLPMNKVYNILKEEFNMSLL
ncbi:MAG: Maf family protein [Candidatus Hermodarchaeota archaeon]